MPRIPDKFLDSIVFLYRTKEEAEQRAKIGGTGFLFGLAIQGAAEACGSARYVTYVVTNKHVVYAGGAPVISINRSDGSAPDIWEFEVTDWTVHPTADLAAICVYGFLNRETHKFSFASDDYLLTPELITEYDLGVGDEVHMGGRFVNHQGTQINRPAARFGNVSMMLENILNPGTEKKEESFAVEMRSRTGFSGAPVVVHRVPTSSITKVPVKTFLKILGVNWGYIKDEETGESTWLNGVVPAWKILELMELPMLKQKHREAEKNFFKWVEESKKATG